MGYVTISQFSKRFKAGAQNGTLAWASYAMRLLGCRGKSRTCQRRPRRLCQRRVPLGRSHHTRHRSVQFSKRFEAGEPSAVCDCRPHEDSVSVQSALAHEDKQNVKIPSRTFLRNHSTANIYALLLFVSIIFDNTLTWHGHCFVYFSR